MVKASTIPGLKTPTTTINAQDGGVIVTWTAPYNYSDSITQYLIEAQTSNGTWSSVCDGQDPTTMSKTSCVVRMSVFTDQSTFNLPF
jgi:hypothetical protein